jgi:hypothetical protein
MAGPMGEAMKTCYWCKGPLKRQRIEHMHEWAGQRFLIRNGFVRV